VFQITKQVLVGEGQIESTGKVIYLYTRPTIFQGCDGSLASFEGQEEEFYCKIVNSLAEKCHKCIDCCGLYVEQGTHLLHNILSDTNHVLFQLLPDQRGEMTYSLRKRPYDSLLAQRTSRISDYNFITLR